MSDTENPSLDTLFGVLNRWRHFAGYPMEPRVDALVGLFLPEVIERCCEASEIHPQVIPQFPLKKVGSNRSDRADFFTLSKDCRRAFLVELKTDQGSLREEQVRYLNKAKGRPLAGLLCELKEIALASRSRGKYLHLLGALSDLGLVMLPKELEDQDRYSNAGVSKGHIKDVKVLVPESCKVEVVFIQPEPECGNEDSLFRHVSFEEFAETIQKRGKLGGLLASHLRKWKTPPGGSFSQSGQACYGEY